jgi:hypothetical protein
MHHDDSSYKPALQKKKTGDHEFLFVECAKHWYVLLFFKFPSDIKKATELCSIDFQMLSEHPSGLLNVSM